MKKESEDLGIPSKWRRFFAYLLDLIINITIIGLIANIIIIFVEKNTLGNMLVGIKTLNNKYNSANIGQISLRYLIFYQTIPLFVHYFCRYYYFISWGLGNAEIVMKQKIELVCFCCIFVLVFLY